MNVLLAGLVFELRWLRRSPDHMLALVVAPLSTLITVAITQHAGRPDLAGYAILAPALIAMWAMALLAAGDIVANERENGSLELLVAAPAAVTTVITGRIATVTTVSLAGFVESWLVAAGCFGVRVPLPHPVQFIGVLIVTAAAMAGTACLLAAVFVLSRSARSYQNSLSYPFYVLGGVLVPVALLPDWIRPAANLVFLSWSSDLLRDTLSSDPIEDLGPRLAAVAGLGLLGYLGGRLGLRRAVDRLRATGSLGHA